MGILERLWIIIVFLGIKPIELLEIYPDGKYIVVGLRYRIPRKEFNDIRTRSQGKILDNQ